MDSNIQRSVRSLALVSVLAGTMTLTTELVAIRWGSSPLRLPRRNKSKERGFCTQRP